MSVTAVLYTCACVCVYAKHVYVNQSRCIHVCGCDDLTHLHICGGTNSYELVYSHDIYAIWSIHVWCGGGARRYAWVMVHIRISQGAYMNETCHLCVNALCHFYMNEYNVIYSKTSCRICVGVAEEDVWMRHFMYVWMNHYHFIHIWMRTVVHM